MDKPLIGKRPTFHRDRARNNSYRILFYLFALLISISFLMQVRSGAIRPLFEPTPTPTRIPESYILEADTYFATGKIDDPNSENDAIDTYRRSLDLDPENAAIWGQLARVLTYSSNLLPTNEQKRERLLEALEAADRAVELNPDDGDLHAIRAFVLDWNASYALSEEEAQRLLTDALNAAVRGLQLDPDNGLAMAFYAEVQLDQQKWSEAEKYAVRAVELSPNSMDAHRVYATLLESIGRYRQAIEEYEKAASLAPNMTFLYISIGVNYRHLAQQSNLPPQDNPLYAQALEYFERAAEINEQLGVHDPLPYIAIAKTYSQMGEFFIASRNAEKALSLDPREANSYGQLGIIYFKSRNYESSMHALQCAVRGCSAADNMVLIRLAEQNPQWGVTPLPVTGLTLDTVEIAYYYAEYAQVLAYLSRPEESFCAEAYKVINEVRAFPQVDEVLLQIVKESENICRTLEGAPPPGTH